MIEWSNKLYLSETMMEKPRKLKKIRKKLEKPDKLRFGAYLITLNSNGKDLFDIYNILTFPATHFKKEEWNVKIIGVAQNSDEAQELAGSIVMKLMKENVSLDPAALKEYFR
ncbi:MAG: hypothetical protein IKP88_08030 [Lachnospiraceae bacterium]|nr:hypothetical protein [Lachnospiraceae bacterium]